MKQTKERLPSVTSQEVTQEEKADRSTIFDDVFRTIAQKMPQTAYPADQRSVSHELQRGY